MNDALSHPERRFAGGRCSCCGKPYLMVVLPGWTWEPHGYCSTTCQRRMAKVRRKMICPVGCGRLILKPGAAVCGPCWNEAASMCKGKKRLTEPEAKLVEQRRGLQAKWCRVCGNFHNVGHPSEDEEALIERVGNILEGMRKARGRVWVLDLIDSWDPEISDRKSWRALRPSAQRSTT
jgi:hypothetical protein